MCFRTVRREVSSRSMNFELKQYTNISPVEREKFESVYKSHLQGNPGRAEGVVLGSKMVLFTGTLLVFM
jgi:hypothetical protein